jgi:uncharacterized membrane protein YbhN (UPF0104 family)
MTDQSREKSGRRVRLFRRWSSVLVAVLILGILGWYLHNHLAELGRICSLSLTEVALLSSIVLFGHLIATLKFWMMARGFDIFLPFWEAFVLTEAGGVLNIVPLNVGSGFRAAYLKQVHRLRVVNFGVGFSGLLVSSLVSAGVLGLAFLKETTVRSGSLCWLFSALIVLPVISFGLIRFLPLNRLRAEGVQTRLYDLYDSVLEGLNAMVSNRAVFLTWLGLDLISGLLLGARYWLIGHWLGYSTDFGSGIVMQSVSRLTSFFTFMPAGALGVREALTGFGAVGLGNSAVSGVMISTVDRIVATCYLIFTGGLSLFLARERIAQSMEAPANGR